MELLLTALVLLLARSCSPSLAASDAQFEPADPGAAVCPSSAPVSAQPARSDVECAVLCAASDSCKAYSHVTPGSSSDSCLMSGRDNCSLAAGAAAFRKKSGQAPTDQSGQLQNCTSPATGPMSAGSTALFMRRTLGNVNFTRLWADYDAGFGSCSGDFWLGLRSISLLLGTGSATWRVEMKLWTGADLFVEYSGFTVGDSSTNYNMIYTAMANRSSEVTADAMSNNNNVGFSTMDRDNDKSSGICTKMHNGQGGFWFGSCGRAFPTGVLPAAANSNFGFVIWDYGSGSGYTSLKEIRMYLKR